MALCNLKRTKWNKSIGFESLDKNVGINIMSDGELSSFETWTGLGCLKMSIWLRRSELTWLSDCIREKTFGEFVDSYSKKRKLVYAAGAYGASKVTLHKPVDGNVGMAESTLELSESESESLRMIIQKVELVMDYPYETVCPDDMTEAFRIVWVNKEIKEGRNPIRVGPYLRAALSKLAKLFPVGHGPGYPTGIDAKAVDVLPVGDEYEEHCRLIGHLLEGSGFGRMDE